MFPLELLSRVWPELVEGVDRVKSIDDVQVPNGRQRGKGVKK